MKRCHIVRNMVWAPIRILIENLKVKKRSKLRNMAYECSLLEKNEKHFKKEEKKCVRKRKQINK